MAKVKDRDSAGSQPESKERSGKSKKEDKENEEISRETERKSGQQPQVSDGPSGDLDKIEEKSSDKN